MARSHGIGERTGIGRWLIVGILLQGSLALSAGRSAAAPLAQPSALIFVDDSVDDGLIAHWRFDEPTASTARDAAGDADATLTSGASQTFGPLPPVGFPDPGVLVLSGVTDTVNIADNAALNTATSVSFTVAMWVRRDAADIGTASTLYDSGTQSGHWYVGFLSNNRLAFTKNNIADFQSTHIVTDTGWHHVAFVRSPSGAVEVYLDGQSAGALSTGAITAPSGDKLIGNKQTGTTPLDGHMDDVRIFDRALSAAEVLRLAQGAGCVTTGQSWTTAMRDLQCALSIATSGQDIWIGEGVYTPGLYRFMPFSLKNGVNIYGGFRGLSPGGNESDLGQRPPLDPAAPLTTLSGDLRGNDIAASFTNYGDNSSVVVFAPNGVSLRIDRLRIQGGNADGVAGGLSNNGGGLRAAPGASLVLNDVVLFANRSTLDGGAVFSQAPLQLTATHFFSNTSANGSGGALATEAPLILGSSRLFNNIAGKSGGALLLNAPAVIEDSVFGNNTASAFYGGAIEASQPLTLTASTFVSNTAGFEGGALATTLTTTVTSSTFSGNRALTFYGGAIRTQGRLSVLGSTFLSNTASFGGGAIAALTTDELIIDAMTARANRALGANCAPSCSHGSGGAIHSVGPVTLTASLLEDNRARLNGGALHAVSTAVLTANTFVSNSAALPVDVSNAGEGGALYSMGTVADDTSRYERNAAPIAGAASILTGTFVSSSFVTNSAATQAGAVLALGPVTLTGTRFVSNTVAAGDGGGVFSAVHTVLSNNWFERNSAGGAGGDGGAVFAQAGPFLAAGNTYTANIAGRFGGAAHIPGDSSVRDRYFGNQAVSEGGALLVAGSMTITHAIFDGNRSLLSGALVSDGPADRSRQIHIHNSLFTGNASNSSAGASDIRLFDVTARIVNNTHADPASSNTPALQVFRSTVTVTNTVFANYATSVAESSAGGASIVQLAHNLFFSAPLASSVIPGAGNVFADPLFQQAASGDYRLSAGSPAIDAGIDGALDATVTLDLAGQPRYVDVPDVPGADVDGVPQVIDIGAYELVVEPTTRLVYLPLVQK